MSRIEWNQAVSQFDMFAEDLPVAEPPPKEPPRAAIVAEHRAAIDALPEKLRPTCIKAQPMPTAKAELDEWTRTTQRLYLLYLIGAIARGIYRESSEANAPYVLAKLNGLGGQW